MKSRSLLTGKKAEHASGSSEASLSARLHQLHASRIAGPRIPQEDWASFNKDDRVTVQRGSDAILTGTIDTIATDRTVFWVFGDEGRGRIAVHADDDVSVWRAQPNG